MVTSVYNPTDIHGPPPGEPCLGAVRLTNVRYQLPRGHMVTLLLKTIDFSHAPLSHGFAAGSTLSWYGPTSHTLCPDIVRRRSGFRLGRRSWRVSITRRAVVCRLWDKIYRHQAPTLNDVFEFRQTSRSLLLFFYSLPKWS